MNTFYSGVIVGEGLGGDICGYRWILYVCGKERDNLYTSHAHTYFTSPPTYVPTQTPTCGHTTMCGVYMLYNIELHILTEKKIFGDFW